MKWQNIIKAKIDAIQLVIDILEELDMEYIEHESTKKNHVKIYFRDPKKPNKILSLIETKNPKESMKSNIKSTIKKLISGRRRRGQGSFKLSEDKIIRQGTWYDILKDESPKATPHTGPAARSSRIVLIEAGFPSHYVRKLNVNKWGRGEHSIIFQINPEYLIEAGEDFNVWLDDRDKESRYSGEHIARTNAPKSSRESTLRRPSAANVDEEAIPYIEQLIDHAIDKWTKDGKP